MTDTTPAYDAFISYADADKAWVEGYLCDALTQASVRFLTRPAFDLGKPLILEFERAIQQSKRVILVLSPAYRVDNIGQFVDVLAQGYGLETSTWPVIPLLYQPVTGLPPRLSALTSLDMTDAATRDEALARIIRELSTVPASISPVALTIPACPYPGMEAFGDNNSDYFYGRDDEIAEMIERLRLHPFLTVIGPSGSGKSSLVFAGLVPRLAKTTVFGAGSWTVKSMRPGQTPLETLTERLGSLTAPISENTRSLIIIDQFEELFTLRPASAIPFQEALLKLMDTPRCYIVITVRADFYPDLMSAPLWKAIQAHRLEVLPLDEKGLRQAIVQPAEKVGVYVESALVERLIADSAGEPGILPLLQDTLVLLWDKLERRFLPLRAYESLVLPRKAYDNADIAGHTGLQAVLSRRADAAVAALNEAITRRIFLRLVQFGEGREDTRRQQPLESLQTSSDNPQVFTDTWQALTKSRLLTVSGEEKQKSRQVDIAHEALIRSWPKLRTWINQRRDSELIRRRLEEKTTEWRRLSQNGAKGGLLDDYELAEAQHWLGSPDAAELGYSSDVQALVKASKESIEAARQHELALQQRANRFLRFIIVGLVIFLAVAFGLTGYAVTKTQEAQVAGTNVAVQRDVAESRALASEANQILPSRLDSSLYKSIQAIRKSPTNEAWDSLLRGLGLHPGLKALLTGPEPSTFNVGVSFSADNKSLLMINCSNTGRNPGESTACNGMALYKWDLVTGLRSDLIDIGGGLHIQALAISPDQRQLVVGGLDGALSVWEIPAEVAQSTTTIAPAPLSTTTLARSKAGILSIAISPDSKLLAVGTCQQEVLYPQCNEGIIELWDIEQKKLITTLTGHPAVVTSLAFSSGGNLLASASKQTILIYDVAKRTQIGQLLKGHKDRIFSLGFSPDNKRLASGGNDGQILIWDLTTPANTPPTPTSLVNDHTPPVPPTTSAPTETPAGSIPTSKDTISTLAFTPDNKILASGSRNGTVTLWDMTAATPDPIVQPLYSAGGDIARIAISPDGKTLAAASFAPAVRLWDLTEFMSLNGYAAPATTTAFSPDVKWLAWGGCAQFNDNQDCIQGQIQLWDVAAHQPIDKPQPVHQGAVYKLQFDPEGDLMASSGCAKRETVDGNSNCTAGEVQLWQVANGQLRSIGTPLTGFGDEVIHIALSTSSCKLLATGNNKTLTLWDVSGTHPTPTKQTTLTTDEVIWSLAFRPDCKKVAIGFSTGDLAYWDMKSNEFKPSMIFTLENPNVLNNNIIYALHFSPDGTKLGIGNTRKQVYVQLGEEAKYHILDGQDVASTAIAFSPNGNYLASGSIGGTVWLWDYAAQKSIGQGMRGHTGVIYSVAFSPDGKYLLSSDGKAVWMYPIDPGLMERQACHLIRGSFEVIYREPPLDLKCPQ